MKDILRKSIKTALIFAVVGSIVATAMPFVMQGFSAMGLATEAKDIALTAKGVLHTTGVFALFGALEPMVHAAFSFVFGDEKADKSKEQAASPALEKSPLRQVQLAIVQAPRLAAPQDMPAGEPACAEKSTGTQFLERLIEQQSVGTVQLAK